MRKGLVTETMEYRIEKPLPRMHTCTRAVLVERLYCGCGHEMETLPLNAGYKCPACGNFQETIGKYPRLVDGDGKEIKL